MSCLVNIASYVDPPGMEPCVPSIVIVFCNWCHIRRRMRSLIEALKSASNNSIIRSLSIHGSSFFFNMICVVCVHLSRMKPNLNGRATRAMCSERRSGLCRTALYKP